MSRSTPDLDVLGESAARAAAPPPRRAGRLTLTVLGLGLVGVALSLLWPLLNPPREVRMMRVRPATGDAEALVPQATGALEDVGWLEAYPFPWTVRPLVKGVVDELHVLEGQRVVAGKTLIGTLRNLDLETELERKKSAVDVAAARETQARAMVDASRGVRDQRIRQRHELARAEGDAAVAKQAVAVLEAKHRAALAGVEVARVDLAAQQKLVRTGSDTTVALARAEARLTQAKEEAAEVVADIELARARHAQAEALLVVDSEAERDPRGLDAEVIRLEQILAVAVAAHHEAKIDRDLVQRLVDELKVVSPRDGVVMRLESAPGAVVGPEGEFRDGEEGGPGSTSRLNRMTGTLVSLYDPAEFQVRVDVLFARLAQIEEGTDVSFTVDAIANKRFEGTVHRFVHEADINQNALQVKIRVKNPDPAMRPEMLCRVRFPGRSAPTTTSGSPAPAGELSTGRYLVPTEAVRDGVVFVFDPREGGKARRVEVTVEGAQGTQSVVRGALGLSTLVILDAVEHGERVKETS